MRTHIPLAIDKNDFRAWLHDPKRDAEITCTRNICATCPVALYLNSALGNTLWRVSPTFAELYATPKDNYAAPVAAFLLPGWATNFITAFDGACDDDRSNNKWTIARTSFDELFG